MKQFMNQSRLTWFHLLEDYVFCELIFWLYLVQVVPFLCDGPHLLLQTFNVFGRVLQVPARQRHILQLLLQLPRI